ncbi:MAG: NUDIX domain-containing protein [bacterium]|nr:NUDIX domain-containing protein [bacterium]
MNNQIQPAYEFAVIATDTVIFTIQNNELRVLLIKMKKKPFADRWAVPGGLVLGDESVDVAAKRHLMNKAGVKNVYLEQLYTFGEVDRDPFGRVVSVAYFALIPSANVSLKTTAEYADVRWFQVNDLPKLAYDHKKIVKLAIERLRAKLTYTNIVFSLLPDEFSLSELQKIYELILGKKFDKRNFRKKILSLNLIKNTGKQQLGSPNRPPELYTFIKKQLENIQIL